MISLDTETTGRDFRFGSKPFFVTTCNLDGEQKYWQWEVGPLTREPDIDARDLEEIACECLRQGVVGQNIKFDLEALFTVHPNLISMWSWETTHDTLIASHLLASNLAHDLTSLGIQYLGVDIEPYEKALEKACKEARRLARSKFPEWCIAKSGLSDMPSIKKSGNNKEDRSWKYDTWLPRAIAKELELLDDHPWWTVLSEYSNADSAVTIALWKEMEPEIKRRGLWEIYLESMKLPSILYGMEQRGVTINRVRTKILKKNHREVCEIKKQQCITASNGEIEDLPVNGVSNALRHVIFNKFGLVSSRTTKKGNNSLDKYAIEDWLFTLDSDSPAYVFLSGLIDYRQRMTSLGYIDAYERFWIPTSPGWAKLYPSLNQTATAHLRMSSSNPNSQQIGKNIISEEDGEGYSARYMFGPAPNREWWSLDYENIERRIPVYESKEEKLIELFENPDKGPYYGNEHALTGHILRPKIFESCLNEYGDVDGRIYKDRYKTTYYQYDKNTNFAVQYGCQQAKADATARVRGAYTLLKRSLPKLDALNQYWINFANKYGYVETLPDKTVCSERGYPILTQRTEYGRVLPTIPLAYHVSGTAVWCARKAMVRCNDYLNELSKKDARGYYMTMYIHDEIVFDFPKAPRINGRPGNLSKALKLRTLMEQSGEDVGIPLRVAVTYNPDNWGSGESIKT